MVILLLFIVIVTVTYLSCIHITISVPYSTLGIFTGHAAIELYAEAFDAVQALDKLEGFLSIHGQQFYKIPGKSEENQKFILTYAHSLLHCTFG